MKLCDLCAPPLIMLLLFPILVGPSGCHTPPVNPEPAAWAVSGTESNIEDAAAALSKAIDQVLTSSKSDDPFLRANAIEAAHGLRDRIAQLVHLGLEDPHAAVRFTAVATAGKFSQRSTVPVLKQLLHDPFPSVRAVALVALRQCGQSVDVSSLADMIRQPDATLRGNVVMLLGRVGDPSAIPMLKDIAKLGAEPQITALEHSIVRIQIAEALVMLGDESGRDVIRAAAFSQHGGVRILAVQMLGRLKDRKYIPALVAMLSKDPVELRLAAAEALVLLGDDRGLEQVLKDSRFELPVVRAQAALALAPFRSIRAARARERMLTDPVEQVRLAAAAAIIQVANSQKR